MSVSEEHPLGSAVGNTRKIEASAGNGLLPSGRLSRKLQAHKTPGVGRFSITLAFLLGPQPILDFVWMLFSHFRP